MKKPQLYIVPALIILGVIQLFVYISISNKNLVRKTVLENADRYANAIAEFRTLYTSEVVQTVSAMEGVKVSHDYEMQENSIPLPVTLSMKLGESLARNQDGAEAKLYSKHPFEWRRETGGLRDAFAREAWERLNETPDKPFYRFEEYKGRPVVRYAIADRMRSACIDCHNSHPRTPKADWKLGDVRGVLEVVQPMDEIMAHTESGARGTYLFASLIGGALFVYLFMLRNYNKQNVELSKMIQLKTEELQSSNEILETDIKLKTSVAGLDSAVREVANVSDLFRKSLEYLVGELRVVAGAIYDVDNDVIRLRCTYAYSDGDFVESRKRFHPGEGFVGQCLTRGTLIEVADVPEEYFSVGSGLGQSRPRFLTLCPILYRGEITGILEFASFARLSNFQKSILVPVCEVFGISLNAAKSQELVKRLLTETQKKSAALRTQQEEMRVVNQDLEQKTQELTCSEIELTQQGEELRNSNRALEKKQQALQKGKREVEAAKMELEIKAEELGLASKYKSEFLANMSHELRTPLNSMLLLAKSFADNPDGNLSESQVNDAQIIYDGGNGLLSLINDILDLAKVEAGMLEIDVRDIEPRAIGLNLKKIFTRIGDENGVPFEVNVSDRVPNIIRTDGNRLEQILKNFLSNSFKFTQEGKVVLQIDMVSQSKKFALISGRDRPCVTFSVSDTGVGIVPEKQQAIFESFQQEDGSTSRTYGGTGLGLTISRELAALLGGSIGLESAKDRGSTFTLTLPLDVKSERVKSDQSFDEPDDSSMRRQPHWSGSTSPSESQPTESVVDELRRPREVGYFSANISSVDDMFQELNESMLEMEHDENEVLKDCKVLLVEDDTRNSFTLSSLLDRRGLNVVIAENGQVALNELEKDNSFDLVLMDIMMPVMDGYEAMKRIRKSMMYRRVPIIALTAKAMQEDKDRCIRAGATYFLTKPFDLERLLLMIRVCMCSL